MSDETTAIATVQLDNEKVRVTEWRFPPGTQTGTHTHEMDYVVVPTTTGTLQVHTPEGVSDNVLTAGQSYTRSAGTTHNVVNTSDTECAFVEIELK
ncbi:cupin domain-containing protein [Nesterenkonia sp. MY13]|uniref:Cupin domain-containing protein n=1 Tax=Nesterenkonia sedimenti TaxID=1463632 RepID=A0A7X8YDW3_9MICC|nr:cupin domain-containing protein [Nesterenkonia sedimenti]NLS09592.1 cupin domain-containing protein [Nesterenkonia sedimenti]